jgi:hypothetical protein
MVLDLGRHPGKDRSHRFSRLGVLVDLDRFDPGGADGVQRVGKPQPC